MIAPRPFQRLLVANRGEIAARIISSARELGLETFAVYTDNDVGHTYNASKAIRLDSPSAYMDVAALVRIAKENNVDAVHPGYGFLSESVQLAEELAKNNVLCIGPGPENLDRTGDKLRARVLAEECLVPVLPALRTSTGDVADVQKFANDCGLPIMIKAVDGGGGCGIRLVREMDELHGHVLRAIEESPSKRVFAEKAAVDDYRHVEVQIVGDTRGNVMHLWERECSIQRRYQKIVELAPSTVADRQVTAPLIEAALAMARRIRYSSLGTFEFLLNPKTAEFYFLEVNPRIQVEHTITESICSVDIVKIQLRLAQGASFADAGLGDLNQSLTNTPNLRSIQLRLTAEDPQKNYALSIGRISSFSLPAGNGVRVDTALVGHGSNVISADFDSVIAKLIITAQSWRDVVAKSRRALQDTKIVGVQTNLALLQAIVWHEDFEAGWWLETNQQDLLGRSREFHHQKDPLHGLAGNQDQVGASASLSGASSSTLFRRDDAWQISLKSLGSEELQRHHLQLTRVLRNDFPTSLAAEVLYTKPGNEPIAYTMDVRATATSAAATSSQHRNGDTSDPSHIIAPLSGKLVEVLIDAGDRVRKNDVVCVIKQMKMEIEVRSPRAGWCTWVTEAEDGEDVAEGMLAAIVEDDKVEAKL